MVSLTPFLLLCRTVLYAGGMMKCSLLTLLSVFLFSCLSLCAQDINRLKQRMNGINSSSNDNTGTAKKDSLVHRDPLADSITISYRYFDSSRSRKIDSSITDFYDRFPVPASYDYLSNMGAASHSLLINPVVAPGFDAGFHSYDIYRYRLADTRFFQTTRPYTELAYMIGSNAEQMVNILHTQNRKSRLNFAFEYRFIGSPGAFKNQNTSHNNLRISSYYQSNNKRYGLYFVYINNKMQASENGGLQDDDQLKNLSLNNPFEANVRLGNGISQYRSSSLFNTTVTIGTYYRESRFYLRHYYDFGQKDSIVQDTNVVRLFYPRLRLQHSISYNSNIYEFHDYAADSLDYATYFQYNGLTNDSLRFSDKWRNLTNEFSLITFPDKKNVAQFLRLSANFQLLKGEFSNHETVNYTNIFASAEYRNRTKNQKWDLEALGQLYMTGPFLGDYNAYISLQRQLSKNLGTFQVGFQNTNKSPSRLSDGVTSFPVTTAGSFNNTNTSRLFGNLYLPSQSLHLYGNYYAITNYIYFNDFYTPKQYSALFNYVNVGLEKKFRLSRHFNWYTDVSFQQSAGNAPIHLPLVYTRNRIAFEGNFYKNLFLSTGIEIRYNTPYKADGYSPLTGQFYFQNDTTISNRPDLNIYLNFRIKSFKAFIRLENLNTFDQYASGTGFLNHNFSAPHYAQNALWLRFGIWWNFVN